MFAAQHRERPLDVRRFHEEMGISRAGVYRALQEPSSEVVAQSLGAALGFSARFVALAHHRDALRRALAQELAEAKKGSEPRIAALRRQVDQLEAELAYENPFSSRGSCERLAFAALRLRYGVGRRQLARAHADRIAGRGLEQFARLRAYEENRPVEGFVLSEWLDTLGACAPAGAVVSRKEHEALAASLQLVHVVSDTMEWMNVVDTVTRGKMQIFGAPLNEPDKRMEWGQTCTAFGAIRVEAIRVKQAEKRERGPMRLVNASHDSFQIAVLLKGLVRVDLSRSPFVPEVEGPPPAITGTQVMPESGREFSAGEVLAFQSKLWHRVEFLDTDNHLLMILIERNVSLGRRLGQRRRD